MIYSYVTLTFTWFYLDMESILSKYFTFFLIFLLFLRFCPTFIIFSDAFSLSQASNQYFQCVRFVHTHYFPELVLVKSASSFFRNDQFDSPQTCIHCHLFQTLDLKQLLAHCKVCPLDRPSESSHRFMCYACAYHTYDSGHMRRHIMAHNALKPYWCPYCNYSSVQHAHLKRHLRKHLNKHFLDTQTS